MIKVWIGSPTWRIMKARAFDTFLLITRLVFTGLFTATSLWRTGNGFIYELEVHRNGMGSNIIVEIL